MTPLSRPVLLLCGDSLTQDAAMPETVGWGVWLQHAFVRSVDVVNRGLCGYNTAFFVEHALPVLREELSTRFQPALITLWLGANDAALVDGSESELHVPLDQYKANLTLILETFLKLAPHAKILVMTPATVDDERRRRIQVEEQGKRPEDEIDRDNAHAKLYAQACAETAASLGSSNITVLDMHAFFMTQYPDVQDRARFFGDGLHFSSAGNRVVYEQVKKQVDALLPKELLDTWQLPCFTSLIQKA